MAALSTRLAVWLLKGVGFLVLAAVGIVFLALLVIQTKLQIDNRGYAARVFDGVVPYSRVIASRQWHPLFQTGGYNCTFAVVELDETAPTEPPNYDNTTTKPNLPHAWSLKYAGQWQQTPVPHNIVRTEGTPGYQCSPYPGYQLVESLLRGADMPGGWYYTDSDTLSVYSKPAGLAFRFRYGD